MNAYRPSTRTRLLILTSLLAPLASCVTQQEYDEMQEMAELYQRQSLDYEDFVPELQAENQLLREELELLRNAGDPIPASYTQEIDERMGELQAMLAGSDELAVSAAAVNAVVANRAEQPLQALIEQLQRMA